MEMNMVASGYHWLMQSFKSGEMVEWKNAKHVLDA